MNKEIHWKLTIENTLGKKHGLKGDCQLLSYNEGKNKSS